MKKTLISLALALVLLCGAVALAEYPDKPITLYCGYSAGGSSDLLCRILAAKLQEKIGQTIVVEDKTGGGGWVLWTEMIKNVAPDGYTFCLINTPNYSLGMYDATNPREYAYDALDVLCNEVSDYDVIAIRADEDRYTDFASLVEYAKTHELFYGSSANGIMSDDGTIGERLNMEMGCQLFPITTGGAKENETFLLNKSTDVLIGNISDVLNGMNAGTFKVVCVFAPERVELIPDVPTCIEMGGTIIGSSDRGYALPKGVDPAIREKLYNALVEAINDPETIKQLEDIGAATNFVPQEEYPAFIEKNIATAKAAYGIE